MAQSASIPVRQYVRYVLIDRNEDPAFVKASVAFADALFYSDAGIGSRDYHLSRARKYGLGLGLDEPVIQRCYETATDLYQRLKQLPPEEQKATRRFAIRYKAELKRRLQQRFRKLMSYSDHEIMMMNSSDRVNISKDIVYSNSDAETRSKIRERTLTCAEYEGWQRRIEEADRLSDRLSLSISVFDPEELKSYAQERLSRDVQIQRMPNSGLFQKYVTGLLGGETLSAKELRLNKLDPENVMKRARGLSSSFRFKKSGEREFRAPRPGELRLSGRKGTNPIAFEEGWENRRGSL